MSGHSRWAQVKHKKAITDTKKGQLFSKFVREITVAARDGGENPETNARLRVAIERARATGLPKDNIERAIARAKGGGGEKALQEFLYETTAQDGIMILIEGITDNKQRTLAEIRQVLMRHNIRLADPGSVLWNFEKIGSLTIKKEANPGRSQEEIELAIVDSGAEDFVRSDNQWAVETKLSALEETRRRIAAQGISIESFGPDFKTRSPIAPSAERREDLERVFEELSDQNDVQEIYSNLRPTA